ncbi:MAG TPA: M36 family metallopeptidase [Nocardioides sp.]
MTQTPVLARRTRLALLPVAGLIATTFVTSAFPSTSAAPALAATGSEVTSTLADAVPGLSDLDTTGRALPTAAQKQAAAAMSATVRWNSFGTPASISSSTGSLGTASSTDPVVSARRWLAGHQTLLGLNSTQLQGLRLVNNQKLAGSPARAVLFEQTFGGLEPAMGSLVTVGVADGKIVYVSSSLTRTTGTPEPAQLTPVAGWQRAAANVGRLVTPLDLDTVTRLGDWSRFGVDGFAQPQLARIRALGFADGSVRPVVQANVVDVQGGESFAYTSLVDAVTGAVLVRHNQVDNLTDASQFSGELTADACGPQHPFELTDGATKQIVVTASTLVLTNDIVIKLFGPSGELLGSGDTGTSPEALTYSSSNIPAGIYKVQICPYADPTVPFTAPGNYAGTIFTSDVETPGATLPTPKWAYFLASPSLDWSPATTPKNRITGCWVTTSDGTKVPGCSTPPGALANLAARGPWDWNFRTNTPTLTTTGNAAVTHEAWVSPLTPGGLAQAPASPTRDYTDAWTDAWNNSGCDPAQLVPGGNDINAVVTNLFTTHNRMHDFAYYLGFTEANYNLQAVNFGAEADPSRENDPEIGNVQAGAIGGLQSGLGRDNANQIALQDGVPGITNQYLFQPIAGAFYSPCTDGSLDIGVVGHEYTHAISNRMIGGPDDGITSDQGGAMGESWSDLDAAEYQFETGYTTGSPWALGGYTTGNPKVGIRDFALNSSPLNYSDIGFDTTGPEVHADGEVWNAVQFAVRKALVNKWNAKFPYTDRALQRRCALGSRTSSPLPAAKCPGNRRWLQLMYDAFLLQQGATSMLDARDAMLAADRMRFHGANQTALWNAYASRGMGKGASTPNADSEAVVPSFASPKANNATVTFRAAAGEVYIGRYEARVTPVADTRPTTKLDNVVQLVPGHYSVLYVGPGRGFKRFGLTVSAGQHKAVAIAPPVNLASRHSGAKVLSTSAGSLNAGSLIDDTESTNWAGFAGGKNIDEQHPFVVVDLAGGVHTVHRVQVSAMLRPAPPSPTDVPLAADPDSGSRFTALRRFAIDVCVSSCGSSSATWKRIYVSPANAFPSVAPRPVSPDLLMRSFDVPDTAAAALRFVALENQCTGYAGFAGDKDNDPLNDTDCKTGSDRGQSVRAAEFEVY